MQLISPNQPLSLLRNDLLRPPRINGSSNDVSQVVLNQDDVEDVRRPGHVVSWWA